MGRGVRQRCGDTRRRCGRGSRRRRLSASGCGCRRATRAGCSRAPTSRSSAGFLDDEGLYVAIINGFPYGPFHGTPVKASVYAPDWRDPARVAYTLDLIRDPAGAPARTASTAACRPRRCPTSRGWPRPTATPGRRSSAMSCGVAEALVARAPGDRRTHSPRYRAGARLLAREHRRDAGVLRAPSAAGRRAAARARARHRGVGGGAKPCSSTSASASTAATSRSSSKTRRRRSKRIRDAGIKIGRIQLSSALDVDGASRPGRGRGSRWSGCARSPTRPTCTRSSNGAARSCATTSICPTRSIAPTSIPRRAPGAFIFTCRCSPPEYGELGSTQSYVADVLRNVLATERDDAPRDRNLHVGRAAGRSQAGSARVDRAASTTGCCDDELRVEPDVGRRPVRSAAEPRRPCTKPSSSTSSG